MDGRLCGAPDHLTVEDMPCLRQRSAQLALASCSCNIPMICSSVCIVRFVVRPFLGPDSSRRWRKKAHGRSKIQELFPRRTLADLCKTEDFSAKHQTSSIRRSLVVFISLIVGIRVALSLTLHLGLTMRGLPLPSCGLIGAIKALTIDWSRPALFSGTDQ